MAVIHGSFYSDCLKFQAHFNAVLPFDGGNYKKEDQRILVLLHGMLDGCDTWLSQTSIHSYAMKHNLLVFMPEGQRSFYMNMAAGGNYHTYLTSELPRYMEAMFGIRWNRERAMIMGNSMGGFGALYAALSCPELFSSCTVFSPVIKPLDSLKVIPSEYQIPGEADAVFGCKEQACCPDLITLSRNYDRKLSLYFSCGYEDFLLDQSREFHRHLDSIGFSHEYAEVPGEHGWVFWRPALDSYMEKFGKNSI